MKLTEIQAQSIINEYIVGDKAKDIAKLYGTCISNVYQIVSGKSYSYLKRPGNIKYIIADHYAKVRIKQLPFLTDIQNDIIIGSLLGDGAISPSYKQNKNCFFYKFQCAKNYGERKEYIDWHYNQLLPWSSAVDKNYSNEVIIDLADRKIGKKHTDIYLKGYSVRTICHPVFTQLRQKWYPNDKKFVPKDIKLTPLIMAIWFCDDGSNDINQRLIRIATHGFTFDDVEFLSSELYKFNVKARIKSVIQHGNKQYFLCISSCEYDKFLELIKSFIIWDCFQYKKIWRGRINYNPIKLDATKAVKIRQLYNQGLFQKQIAEQFGVHVNTINRIIRGISWRNNVL